MVVFLEPREPDFPLKASAKGSPLVWRAFGPAPGPRSLGGRRISFRRSGAGGFSHLQKLALSFPLQMQQNFGFPLQMQLYRFRVQSKIFVLISFFRWKLKK